MDTASAESAATGGAVDAGLPVIVSLFAGAGGLDLGFTRAGFDVRFATDISPSAMATHAKNFPGTKTLVSDLSADGAALLIPIIRSVIAPGSRIGVIGGPPCQGFSYGNPSSVSDDPRNELARVYVEVVAALSRIYRVEFTVFENVPGLMSKRHRATYDQIVNGLSATGLNVRELVLLATDFGVPQSRKRVVLVGLADAGASFTSVESANMSPVDSVRAAIGHLAEPAFYSKGAESSNFPVHPNHWTMRPRSARFTDAVPVTTKSRSFRRLDWSKPSPTIAFGHREIHVHPNGRRRLSIYEAMLLQGFPHQFVLMGTLSQQAEQVSNAVPPPLAESVAEQIKKVLSGL